MANSPTKVIICLSLMTCLLSCGDLTSELATVSVSPLSTKIGINQSTLFSAVAKAGSGKIVQVNPTWSVTGNIGTISSNGLFIAGNVEVAGKVRATVNSLYGESSVTITAKSWITGKVEDEIGHQVQRINVYIDGTSFRETTGPGGSYSLSDVPAGSYFVGTNDPRGRYKPITPEAVTVASGETVRKNFVIFYYSRPPDTTPPTL